MIMDFKSFNFIHKPIAESVAILKDTFVPFLTEKVPPVWSEGIVLLYGSAVEGKLASGSDVDILLVLPKGQLLKYRAGLGQLSSDCWKTSPIDISFAVSVEDLFSENAWNNDFLLHVLSRAVVLHDPKLLMPTVMQRFKAMPETVRKDKIISAGWQTIKWLTRLGRKVTKGDHLGAATARAKLIKLSIVLLHLKEGMYWDSHDLYFSAKNNFAFKSYWDSIDVCVAQISNGDDECLLHFIKSVQADIVEAGLLPKEFYKQWEPWKNPRPYSVSMWLI
jgi:hypothetical protein